MAITTKIEFIEYLKILFRNNPTIVVKASEVKEQAMKIVNNTKKHNHNGRSDAIQIDNALRGCALEYAILKCVPKSYKNPKEFNVRDSDSYVWDNKADFLGEEMFIDCTLVDERGYFSAVIKPAGVNRSDGYDWGKFRTKEKNKNLLDFLVGGSATIDGTNIICKLSAIADVKDAFDYSNWLKSSAFNHEHAMYLSETVTHKV